MPEEKVATTTETPTITISVTEFKTRAGAYLKQVRSGVRIVLTRYDKPMAVIDPLQGVLFQGETSEAQQITSDEWSARLKLIKKFTAEELEKLAQIADILQK